MADTTPLSLIRSKTRVQLQLNYIKDISRPLKTVWTKICTAASKGYYHAYIRVGGAGTPTGKAMELAQTQKFEVTHLDSQPGVLLSETFRVSWSKGERKRSRDGEVPLTLLGLIQEKTRIQLLLNSIEEMTKPLKSVWRSIDTAAKEGYDETTVRVGGKDTPTGKALELARTQGFTITFDGSQEGVKRSERYIVSWRGGEGNGEKPSRKRRRVDVSDEEGGSEGSDRVQDQSGTEESDEGE